MKTVILAGGTGSIALQRGLYHALDEHLDGFDTKIIVNAYDNGLSTGAVRHVMNGQILGPSDVRKNQVTRLRLRDPRDSWIEFLDSRFTVESSEACRLCKDETSRLIDKLLRQGRYTDYCNLLFDAIDEFFRSPLAPTIDYQDFALANIIYAGLARANGNSLRTAARIMALAMRIPDNVLLNDDTSLFLGATTQSGKRIADEGDIVSWGNKADSFVDIFFVDPDGNKATPELCLEAWQAIVEADLLVLSAGTQWSSLIPTYASRGFKAAVNASKAKVLMVMNRAPDQDSPGQTASDIVNLLVPCYFEERRLHVLTDENGHPNMRCLNQTALSKIASFTRADLSNPADSTDRHDPTKLANALGYVFFKEYVDSDFLLFDYDDTLFGRANQYPKSSRFNIKGLSRLNWLAEVGVCTGNTIRALNLRSEPASIDEPSVPIYKPLLIFADGGANEYSYDTRPVANGDSARFNMSKCISPDALLPASGPYSANRIIETLRRAGVPLADIDNRGDALIAIKPIDSHYRRAVISFVQNIICGSDLEVRESGRTTVEIRKPSLSKMGALKYLRSKYSTSLSITYVGDELDLGNDRDIDQFAAGESGIKCLRVTSPAKTAFFIHTLVTHLEGRNSAHRPIHHRGWRRLAHERQRAKGTRSDYR